MTPAIDRLTHSPLRRHVFFLLLFLVTATGFFLRLLWLNRSLEYDEIWTLTNYLPLSPQEIINSLEAPNNHPLSSILMKYSVSLFGTSFQILRLPALICGIAIIPLTGYLIFLVTRSQAAVLTGMLLTSCNPMLIEYSQTARGYSLQCLMLLLMALAAVLYEQSKERRKVFFALLLMFSGLAVIFSVTSGIIFVTSLATVHVLYIATRSSNKLDFHLINNLVKSFRSNLFLWLAYVVIFGIGTKWLVANYDQLRAGQATYGTPIRSLPHFVLFLYLTFSGLTGLMLLIFAFWGMLCRLRPLRATANLGILTLVSSAMIMAVIFSAGPPRSYMPLIPFMLTAVAIAVKDIAGRFSGKGITARNCCWSAIILIGLGSAWWSLPWFAPDWKEEFKYVRKNIPSNTYVCYPANATYPLMWNTRPQIFLDTASRTENILRNGGIFIQLGTPGNISVMDIDGAEKKLICKVKSIRMKFLQTAGEAYALSPASQSALDIKDIIFAVIGPDVESKVVEVKNALLTQPTGWHVVNPWLTTTIQKNNGSKDVLQYSTLAKYNDGMTSAAYKELEDNCKGMVKFYVLRELPR